MALIYEPKTVIYTPQQVMPAEPVPATLAPAAEVVRPQLQGRDITYRAPALHHEPRVDPVYQDLPLSHRARKQVYMASSIFESGGPRGEAIYTPSRQNAVYGNLRRSLDQVREQPELQLPCPADFRATVNAGHGVVEQSGAPRCTEANPDFVSFGGGPDLAVVHANRDQSSLPREFWATSSNLDWKDTRAEFCCGPRPSQEPRADSADVRKRRELSSEVFGSQRRIQKSTSSPSADLWSQTQKHFNSYDSRLGPRPRSPRIPEEGQESNASSLQVPMTARARLSRNLSESDDSQFTRYPEVRGKAAASESPGPGRMRRGAKDEDDSFRSRRRAERNYSDLFGNQAASPRQGQRRQEFNSTSNCSFLDHQVEIANRNVAGWRQLAPTTPREASQSEVLPGPSPEQMTSRATPAVQEVRNQERACWDTTSIMESTSEIARRNRQSRSNSAGRRDVEVADLGAKQSASERKRLDLSSGQFRRSNGYEPKSWDDGRKGPGPAKDMPTAIARSTPSSPLGAPWRNVANDSAKQRRIMSLMSSVVF